MSDVARRRSFSSSASGWCQGRSGGACRSTLDAAVPPLYSRIQASGSIPAARQRNGRSSCGRPPDRVLSCGRARRGVLGLGLRTIDVLDREIQLSTRAVAAIFGVAIACVRRRMHPRAVRPWLEFVRFSKLLAKRSQICLCVSICCKSII